MTLDDIAPNVGQKFSITYLVGHSDENRQQKHVAIPDEFSLDVFVGQHQEIPDHAAQERNGDHEVIAVGFDEVVASNRRGVDVVFAEWTEEILKNVFLINFVRRRRSPNLDRIGARP